MENINATLPIWSVVPFVMLLLGIAVLPLVREHWWEKNYNKAILAAVCGVGPFLYFLWRDWHLLAHTSLEYFQFLVLLFSLFTISGGIFLSGDLRATPKVNTSFLLIGAILANFVGTTGAAMLLIRPIIRTNSQRKNTRHIPVFFIFVVANVGGSLLPIGDPPLFLGFLRGVPFFWTLHLFFPWLTAVGLISIVFFIWDTIAYAGESQAELRMDDASIEPLALHGKRNIPLLVGVVLAVAFMPSAHLPASHWYGYVPWREITMLSLTAASLWLTPLKGSTRHLDPRKENKFTFHAITEVAVLFAGIFTAMIPALQILEVQGGVLPVKEAWHFFFVTGTLSGFLDNAPTYLTFLALAQGQSYAGADAIVGVNPLVLQGISLGAVFMGALTYIGNAPNFMVKSISDEAGLKMPTFAGYLLWAVVILLPIFFAINIVFLGLRPW
jgi:Na+/H+ antiporter NhaD/arsenite permease-like protein